MSDIEIVKRNGPKRIGISIGASAMRRLTIMEATSLMVHLGAVIDWAIAEEGAEADAAEVHESNEKGGTE